MPRVLAGLEARVAAFGAVVRRGGDYDQWDLRVEGGALGSARLRSCVEWHGDGRQLFRFDVIASPSRAAWVMALVPLLLGLWAALDGSTGVAVALNGIAATVGLRAWLECGASTGVLIEGVEGVGPEVGRSRIQIVESEPVRPRDVRAAG